MRRDGAELMEKNEQWRLTVGAEWNGVAGDSGDFRRELADVCKFLEEDQLILEGGFFGERGASVNLGDGGSKKSERGEEKLG